MPRYLLKLDIQSQAIKRRKVVTPGMMGFSDAEWDTLAVRQKQLALDNALEEWSKHFVTISWDVLP